MLHREGEKTKGEGTTLSRHFRLNYTEILCKKVKLLHYHQKTQAMSLTSK